MLSIRLQRTGRKGHAQYRVIVQESWRTPVSGRVVSLLGNYDPHTKQANINKEQAQKYLDNGAQPSERVIRLLSDNGVKIPAWAQSDNKKQRSTRNPDKLRKNQPAEEKPEAEAAAPEEESAESAPEANDAEAEKEESSEAEEITPPESTDDTETSEKAEESDEKSE